MHAEPWIIHIFFTFCCMEKIWKWHGRFLVIICMKDADMDDRSWLSFYCLLMMCCDVIWYGNATWWWTGILRLEKMSSFRIWRCLRIMQWLIDWIKFSIPFLTARSTWYMRCMPWNGNSNHNNWNCLCLSQFSQCWYSLKFRISTGISISKLHTTWNATEIVSWIRQVTWSLLPTKKPTKCAWCLEENHNI